MDIKELEEIVKQCKKCDLYKERAHVVVGDGNINSPIMLIGEGPGYQEDLTGIAFVGPAGQLLNKMLSAINLDRQKVYICNIVKCRPPKNRNPHEDEMAACMDYLRMQYIIQKPKYVLLLGSIACKNILGKDFSIMKEHGVSRVMKGTLFMPTFHPSALLRNEELKKPAWEDLKKFKKILEESGFYE